MKTRLMHSAAGVAAALVVGALLMLAQGRNPLEAYGALLDFSLGGTQALYTTLRTAIPLVLTGLSASLAFSSGPVNLGQPGQLVMGALLTTVGGLVLDLPPAVELPLLVVLGCLGGAAWAGVAAALRRAAGMSEFIVTLMLNMIADSFTQWVITGPLLDPAAFSPMTRPIAPGGWLPDLAGLPGGVSIAALAGLLTWLVSRRSRAGYEWRMTGLGELFARVGGCRVDRNFVWVMLSSGALAGLAGALLVMGGPHRFIRGIGGTYAWDGVMIAMVAASGIGAGDRAAQRAGSCAPVGHRADRGGGARGLHSAHGARAGASRGQGPDPVSVITGIITGTLSSATPIILAALGGGLTFHAGVFNIAMEGMMLAGAFCAVLASFALQSWVAGLLFAVVGSTALAAVFALFALRLRADEFVTGIAVNLFAVGATTYLLRQIFGVKGVFTSPRVVAIPALTIPGLADLPLLGPILSGRNLMTWITVAAVAVCAVAVRRTRWGLRLRAAGSNAACLDSSGVSSRSIRLQALLACGVLCGLAGASLSLGYVRLFGENMSAGRGWISLAAVILVSGSPPGIAAVCLVFGLADGLGLMAQGLRVPTQFSDMAPYVATLVALFIYTRRAGRARERARPG